MDCHHTLKIVVLENCPNRDKVVEYYTNIANKVSYEGDSGVDLVFPKDVELFSECVTKVGLGIRCELCGPMHVSEAKPSHACEGLDNNSYCLEIRPGVFQFSGTYDNEGYMLIPRSSISSTPLCMANSIGIIDRGYRGELIVPIRCFRDIYHHSTLAQGGKYEVKSMQRLFQIVAFDGKPIHVKVTTELSESKRGESGFCSTNNNS